MVDFDAVKLDDIFMLNFLEELYLFSYRLQGTRVFLLDRDLEKEVRDKEYFKDGNGRVDKPV